MNSNNTRVLAILGIALGTVAVLGVLALAWLTPQFKTVAAASDTPTPTTQSEPITADQKGAQITVRGSGTITAKPDTIKLSVGVAQQDTTVKAAQAKVTEVINAMTEKLKAAGVSDRDYRTSQYNVEPVFDYSNAGDKGGANQPAKLIGFRITNMLDITLHDTARASELLDNLTTAGANLIYGVNYTFADPDALTRQAYDGAMQDAQSRATKIAGLASQKIIRTVSVVEASANIPGPVYGPKDGMGGGGAGPVFPGQQSVQVDLIVTYDTVPAR